MPGRTVHELALEFRRLSTYLTSGGSPAVARQRLIDLAPTSIPGCDWAGITARPENGQARLVACSDDIARRLDELQDRTGQGPCLEAAAGSESVRSGDLSTEARWPEFTALALEDTPVRGVLAFHLMETPSPTALNLYAGTGEAFDDDAVTLGALFATHASVLMALADSTHEAATLGAALSTSRQIGAAVGILMSVHRVTEPEAFELLKHASNHLNRKLRDIARDVTETGQLPESDAR
ncbi:GAF and ANTAR domain-containing protein [Brachybacterium sp. GCM10030267]|uniref:GAF and ANTAR domain-containing protein n=1 Tax=Brachybacterium sp. GCM10030267 TaxID=3273381 RepID=UPI00361E7C9F